MKKSFRRIFAVAIAAMMIALMVPFTASAAGSALTLKSPNANFKFDVYKIADLDTTSGKLTVVAANDSGLNDLLKAQGSAENTAAIVAKCDTEAEAGTLQTKKDTFDPSSTEDTKQYEGAGFYFIKPIYKGTGTPLVMKSMLYILTSTVNEVFNMSAAKMNDGQPTIDKKITDATSKEFDANGEYATGQLGDDITYTLTASVPGSADNPIEKYDIIDTYEAGLTPDTAKANVTVKLNDTETDKFTINAHPDNHTFTVSLDKSLFAVGTYPYATKPNADVTVVFKAKVNGDATLGNNSNDNSDALKYANKSDVKTNPDGSTTTTDHDIPGPTVQVFCFGIRANKVDGAGDPLKGAVFSLEGPGLTKVTTASADTTGLVWFDKVPISSAKGIDRTYTLKEESAPEGYQLIDTPFTFQVPALNAKAKDGVTDPGTSSKIYELNTVSAPTGWTYDATTGIFSLATDVVNPKIYIPETGGAGTWMFTLGGAVLIMIAGAMFIIIKKKSSSK